MTFNRLENKKYVYLVSKITHERKYISTVGILTFLMYIIKYLI